MSINIGGGICYADSQVAVANQIFDFCTAQMPFSAQQGDLARMFAIAAVANADRETSLNPKAVGDQDTAYGLWQWHSIRRAVIKQGTGVDVWDQTVQSALIGMRYEMTVKGGEYGHAFAKIIACTTPEDASVAWCTSYELASAANAISRSRSLATAWDAYFTKSAPSG